MFPFLLVLITHCYIGEHFLSRLAAAVPVRNTEIWEVSLNKKAILFLLI